MTDWGVPITLLAETPEQVADAQRELVRVGIARPAVQATGQPEQWAAEAEQLRELRLADFPALAAARAGNIPAGLPAADVLLDVRMTNEWRGGQSTAPCTSRTSICQRLVEVPDRVVWVHCGSGYRATAAASMLANAGREAVVIDDRFDRVGDAGLEMVTEA